MACVPAPTCRAALAEANRLFPNRSTASDGICSSATHTGVSDHDKGEAFDTTHDPAHGCDCNILVNRVVARRDPRVKYIIWNRTIWRSYNRQATSTRPFLPAWQPEPYTGPNPHTKHAHISILESARNNVAPWWGEEGDDMFTDDDRALLAATKAGLDAVTGSVINLERLTSQDPNVDAAHIARGLNELRDRMARIEAKIDAGAASGGGGPTPDAIIDRLKDRL